MAPRAGTFLAWVVILFAALVAADVDPVVIKVSFKSAKCSQRVVLNVIKGLTFLLQN